MTRSEQQAPSVPTTGAEPGSTVASAAVAFATSGGVIAILLRGGFAPRDLPVRGGLLQALRPSWNGLHPVSRQAECGCANLAATIHQADYRCALNTDDGIQDLVRLRSLKEAKEFFESECDGAGARSTPLPSIGVDGRIAGLGRLCDTYLHLLRETGGDPEELHPRFGFRSPLRFGYEELSVHCRATDQPLIQGLEATISYAFLGEPAGVLFAAKWFFPDHDGRIWRPWWPNRTGEVLCSLVDPRTYPFHVMLLSEGEPAFLCDALGYRLAALDYRGSN